MSDDLTLQPFDVPALRAMSSPRCRVAVISLHTSPLEQAGRGDSGGMNVYIRKVAVEMAARGVSSDIFTRRTHLDEPDVQEVLPGVRVFAVTAGPQRPVHKDRLPILVKHFTEAVAGRAKLDGPYDLIHAHYWLSGVAGAALKERWNVPLIVSFHTLARVKDASNPGDVQEPLFRKRGEDTVIAAADRVVAATEIEREELVRFYDADHAKVAIVPPGVDLGVFHPRGRDESRARFGFGDRPTVVFVGRLQPLKGPRVALAAMARLKRLVPDARLVIAGDDSPRRPPHKAESGRGRAGERVRLALAARRLRVVRRVEFLEPIPHDELADLYRAADVVVFPSASESFGLVALEAAACGTPVVATNVGGLKRIVRDGETGYLVPRQPAAFAAALSRLLADRGARERMGAKAVRLASAYPWSRTADSLLDAYASVLACPGVEKALEGSTKG